MGIFKGNGNRKQIDDNVETVNDFVRQVPFWNYRPVEYRIDEFFLTGFVKELDSYIERLLAGDIDDANGDVLDNIICDTAATVIKELGRQKVNHDDFIVDMYLQTEGAINSLNNHLEKISKEREQIESELEDISVRCERDKYAKKTEVQS